MLSTRLNRLEKETVGSKVMVLIGVGVADTEQQQEQRNKDAVVKYYANGRRDVSVLAMPFGNWLETIEIKQCDLLAMIKSKNTKNPAES